MIFVFLLALFASTTIAYPTGYIIIYGDVHKDVEFFNRTFPWIIDNIGGNLYIDYHLLGSGRYSVPQGCTLDILSGNAFLQAQYLRCEAKGYPGEYCLCEAGIEPQRFKQCVAYEGFRAGLASEKFSELGINFSPIVDLGSNNTVFAVDDISLLKKICTVFGDNPPRGCIHYSNQTESFLEKKALAQFDRACLKEFPIDDNKPEVETTSTPWTTPTTTPDWWSTTTTEWPSFTTTTSAPWVTPTTKPDWWPTTTTEWPSFTTTTSAPWVTPTTKPDWWPTTTTEWPTTTTEWPSFTTTTSAPWVTPTTKPDWWTTTMTSWLCNTQPSDSSTTTTPWPTTSTPWFTTSPPWSTTPPPWSTTSPPWSTTSPPWSTTPPPWPTTSPSWSTTSPPWFTTTTPATLTTPQLSTTTPRPTRPTLWPTWWPTRTTARPTRSTPSNPWAVNEEVTQTPLPTAE